jgi:uncharacterized protein YcbX
VTRASRPVVSALYCYPVKSCGGTRLEVADLDARGIEHDREFMVVDPEGMFFTQRELPRLALIRPTRTPDALELSAPGMSVLRIAPHDQGARMNVTIFRDHVAAVDQGNAVAEWLGAFLDTACRLVRQADEAVRPVDPNFARRPTDQVAFSDGYPLLLVSEESVADLNTRLEQQLPINRFRPNVVVRGAGVPYAEDCWSEACIGDVGFSLVKASARCVITTTDQVTAGRGVEPLATLATYRRVPRGVLFGQNLIHHSLGRLHVGDEVRVQARRAPEVG